MHHRFKICHKILLSHTIINFLHMFLMMVPTQPVKILLRDLWTIKVTDALYFHAMTKFLLEKFDKIISSMGPWLCLALLTRVLRELISRLLYWGDDGQNLYSTHLEPTNVWSNLLISTSFFFFFLHVHHWIDYV